MPVAVPETMLQAKHYLIAPHSFFGHVGPAIGLANNLLSLAPHVVVTLLVPSAMSAAAQHVLKRYDPDRARLHVVCINVEPPLEPESDYREDPAELPASAKVASNAQINPRSHHAAKQRTTGAFTSLSRAYSQIDSAVKALSVAYTRLLNLQPLVDAVTQTAVPAFEVPPHVAIIDITIAAGAIAVLPQLNVAANVHVKLLCFSPLSAQWAMWAQVQSHDGEYPGYMERCERIMQAPPEKRDAAYQQWIGENEDVIWVPGLPPMYVYETCPNRRDEYVSIMLPVLETLHLWDGLVNIWPTCLGQEFQAHNDRIGMPCFQVNPEPPPSDPNLASDLTPDAQRAKTFLDGRLKDRGAYSVVYIAFGTLFFSPSRDQLRVLLQALRDLGIPFILAIGGADEDIKTDCFNFAAADPMRAMVLDGLAPQAGILAHSAIMAFLTHGGSSSTLQGIANAVPLVFWPASYDQVQTAVGFSHEPLRIGVELLQVRNGYSIGRGTASGVFVHGTEGAIRDEITRVFESLRGELGTRLRARVKQMKGEVEEDRQHGESRLAMDKVLSL